MFFRTEHELRGVSIDTRSLPQAFSVAGLHGHEVQVELRAAFTEEQPGGQHASTAVCETRSRLHFSLKIEADFRALSQARLPTGSHVDRDRWGTDPDFLDPAGRITAETGVPFRVLPQRLQEAIRGVRIELDNARAWTIGLVRWRIADDGPSQPVVSRLEQWSFDGSDWRHLPLEISVETSVSLVPPISERVRNDVQQYLNQGVEEPLAHALWREAWELRDTSPRGALLIGMAALEVGVKQYISAVVPDAGWLLEELPAPPVHRLLGEYIPKLPTLSGSPASSLDPAVQGIIRDGQHLRNRVAHTGTATVRRDKLKKTLETIRGVLWTLDTYRGFDWAINPHDK